MADPGLAGCCQLTLVGPVAASVLEAIRTRFDPAVKVTAGGTVLTVGGVDQPAIRALLIMLWDSGHEVLAMTVFESGPMTDSASSAGCLAAEDTQTGWLA